MLIIFKRGWIPVLLLIITNIFTSLWSEQVSSILIEGPKRTREETLLQIIAVKPGDEIDETFLEDVEQRLRKSGLFQEEMDISLVPQEKGTELHITVYDRWTLLGFPIFSASDGNWSAGLFFIDSNLGGRANLLLSSVMYGSEGNLYAFGVFRDPSFLESDFAFTTRISGGRNRTQITDLAEEEVRADFVADSMVLGFGTGQTIRDRLDWRVSVEGEYLNMVNAEVVTGELPEDGGSLNLEGRLSFDDQKVSAVFARGVKASIQGKTFWSPGDRPELNLTG
ncbi:MAG: hypothetical protein JXA95_07845, partial [Spirochaetales bacterium]|nr:hypothetical protein [Spirochaetales bacterium]